MTDMRIKRIRSVEKDPPINCSAGQLMMIFTIGPQQ